MEQIKRKLSSDFDDFKRQKLQTTTDPIRYFESLSNELIYEIFEYLDYVHVYQAFSNLNQRFSNLVHNSNFPIKINISPMSKSTFKSYNEDIIKPNTHRITSLHFSNTYRNDFVLLTIPNLSEFQRLETLILYDIELTYIENLLNQIQCLSLLSSLVLTSNDEVPNKSTIYRRIFRLASLKYCKISAFGSDAGDLLPVCINEYSSIEHLIIVRTVYFNEIDRLLSYVPQLRRLSFHALSTGSDQMTTISSNRLKCLTHLSFKLINIKFDQLIQLFKDVLENVEVLHLTVEGYDIDRGYMDANKWKHIILTYIPKLRIFDFLFGLFLHWGDDLPNIETEIKQFNSSFWIERQWFFTHYIDWSNFSYSIFFYSSKPFRKKHYTLYEQVKKTNPLHKSKSNLNSVQYVHIRSEQSVIESQYYFPNAIEATFERGFPINDATIVVNLNSIIPLNQLQKLIIELSHVSVQKVIKLLYHTPNIHTLDLLSMRFYKQGLDYISIQQSEEFQFVSKKNHIENIRYGYACKLEQIKFLVALCPRMKYLTINTRLTDMELILRFLLDKTNPNTRHLCALGFSGACNKWSDKLDQLIQSEKLLEDYTLKQINWCLCLSW